MTLQFLTAIAQISTAIAIIPSLVFVSRQVAQATQAVRASASQAHAALYHAISASIIDDTHGFARVWRQGLQGTEALSEEDAVRFFAFTSSLLRFYEAARVQRLGKQLDTEHWRALEHQARDLASSPGVQEVWAKRRHWHCVNFQGWFESLFD